MDFANSLPDALPEGQSLRGITAELKSLVEADEELIHTAHVATLEADRSIREVDRWRLEASLQSKRVDDMRREKALLQKELGDLDRRIAQERKRKEPPAPPAARDGSTGGSSPGPGGPGGGPGGAEADLSYLIGRALASLDAAQTELSALRRQHADIWHCARQAQDDVTRLRSTYEQLAQREEKLLQQQFLVRAAEADPESRRAAELQQSMERLFAQLAERRSALQQNRTERAAMVSHLIEGAGRRRRRARHVQEVVFRRKGIEGHTMLFSLQEENDRLHEKYEQIVRDGEEEGVVLVDYLDVLQQRLIALLQAKMD